jgi:hypothetical protein
MNTAWSVPDLDGPGNAETGRSDEIPLRLSEVSLEERRCFVQAQPSYEPLPWDAQEGVNN